MPLFDVPFLPHVNHNAPSQTREHDGYPILGPSPPLDSSAHPNAHLSATENHRATAGPLLHPQAADPSHVSRNLLCYLMTSSCSKHPDRCMRRRLFACAFENNRRIADHGTGQRSGAGRERLVGEAGRQVRGQQWATVMHPRLHFVPLPWTEPYFDLLCIRQSQRFTTCVHCSID
ncbi:hypothetical protein BDV95DRAFT_594433 [Massariosphaeria phaeospora]|uniref:Uncharacterized protein n=1 Tax=Massariosphaeria phaeospora TaxID=100035 RepID=A0A7C8M959_9PLEO|nr:hypothetical protein BDV95DRAFT_594433 [Massariosphaeria phaeospora]